MPSPPEPTVGTCDEASYDKQSWVFELKDAHVRSRGHRGITKVRDACRQGGFLWDVPTASPFQSVAVGSPWAFVDHGMPH
eukprot:1177499-Pyramimonas_sp.AAC.1